MFGSELTLLLMMGPVVPVPAPRAVMDALTEVQVTASASSPGGFQLTLTAARTSPIHQVLLPTGFLDPGLRVVITVVVRGVPTVLVDGVLTRQDVAPAEEAGASTVTLTGEDLTLLMDLAVRRDCYPGLSANARVAAVCARYAVHGVVPAPVPPLQPDIPNPAVDIPVQSSTDLAYVRGLARDVGYVFHLEPGPTPGTSIAYWGPEVRVGVPQPALTVGSDTVSNVESLSFGYDGTSAQQLSVTVTEPFTKRAIPVPIPDVGLLRPPLAARPARRLREGPLPDTAGLSTVQAALLGLARTAEADDAVSGSGSVDVLRYGHVLRARRLVGVRGAGLAYDGLYYVRSVTSTLRRGGFTQSFSLARDGVVANVPRVPA
ncbi:hypothetical protein [Actinomycetospora cinnamomea]|uniref:Phage protein D n=1 Tax=Actinomycetospora cinnamomea TaxID=663609 RepID=A0A2U1F895_9PSEU|nr:hypothetical protein [Actinomycetospora cinnamomea]PVZ08200.1 hypothetical protein C8D89_10983 [Actinomycetospora cinnamomea]